jgi:hypothetical protein
MSYFFSFFFPALLLMLLVQSLVRWFGKSSPGRWWLTLILGIISVFAVIVPVGGLPLGRWLISLNANFSIPLTALVFNKVWQNAGGRFLLGSGRRPLLGFWIYGAVTGLALYPMALGLGMFDPYVLGWDFSLLFVVFLVLTVILLYFKNRLGIVLMLCILSYNLQLLESPNLWDYFIDPIFVIISYIQLIKGLIKGKDGVTGKGTTAGGLTK